MRVVPRIIRIYFLPDGGAPFEDWHAKLRDKKARAAILNRLDRLRSGNFGDHKRLNNNLYELRIHLRPGYRVYFSEVEEDIVIILCGGTKKTQDSDIEMAQAYWDEFRSRQQ